MKTINFLPSFLTAVFLLIACGNTHAQIITTVAGGDTTMSLGDGGPASACALNDPTSVAFDAVGNYYIADRYNDRIRKVSTAGIITTIAGTGTWGFSGDNGPATAAELDGPFGIAIDTAGNIYFSDDFNNRIRKINTAGIITTIAGTSIGGYNGDGIPATTAEIYGPGGVAVDGGGNIYFSDGYNHLIRKIDASGTITTVAGTGIAGYNGDGIPATSAEINYPDYVSLDRGGNLYIADYSNQRIRKVSTAGIMTTIAGTGTAGYNGDGTPATAARLRGPAGVFADDQGNVYIGDMNNNVVRRVSPTGIITTLAGDGWAAYSGDGGPATMARLNGPVGMAMDAAGNLYVADGYNNRVRRVEQMAFLHTVNTERPIIKLYPNPTTDVLMIKIDENVYNNVTISNCMGQVMTSPDLSKGEEMLCINVSKFPAGFYYVTFSVKNGSVVEKFVKM